MLADDLFWLSVDDMTGQPRLRPAAAGVGLAAAMLSDLLLSRRAVLMDWRIIPVGWAVPAGVLPAPIAGAVADHGVGTLDIPSWLAQFAPIAHEVVADALRRAGRLRKEVSRHGLSNRVRWMPADPNVSAWPFARLSTRLAQCGPVSEPDAVLLGLVFAVGLGPRLLDGIDPAGVEHAHRLLAGIAEPLRAVLAYAESEVGALVLAYQS